MKNNAPRFVSCESLNSFSESYVEDLEILQNSDCQPSSINLVNNADYFLELLYELREEQGRPIKKAPRIGGSDVNLYKLFMFVEEQGGYNKVENWRLLAEKMGVMGVTNAGYQFRVKYEEFIVPFEKIFIKKFFGQESTNVSMCERRLCSPAEMARPEELPEIQPLPILSETNTAGLRELKLTNFPFTEENLEQILSKYPYIENLELGDLSHVMSYENINFPKTLKRLVLYKVNKDAAVLLLEGNEFENIEYFTIDIDKE